MSPRRNDIRRKKQQRVAATGLLLAVISFMFFFVLDVSAVSHSEKNSLSELITNGGYLLGTEDKALAYQEDRLFLPASTLKIITTLASFDLLGPDFRFETHLYLDSNRNLYIKGLGDPFLTSEEILRLCYSLQHSLKELGVTSVQSLFLDFSAYSIGKKTPGSLDSNNPYDAPNGALAVNFNSLAINKLSDGTIISAEPQTPTLKIMQLAAKDLQPGKQRININSVKTKTELSASEQYVGELFQAQLQIAGVIVEKRFEKKTVPPGLSPVLQYKNSKTLQEVMRECLLYSNNFIANQVFLYFSSRQGTIAATWEKSRDLVQSYLLTHLGLLSEQFTIYDGAGLSRKNQISARGLVRVLENFAPYKNILPQKNGLYVKSGTLDGVYCYGGYLKINNHSVPFAILLNQQRNTRDDLLQQLELLYFSQM
ncbi:D-alanyl-D-alanine carboxypeptidase/D-alanyl-D-alanine endopeptidase [Desulforhopalus sp. 52FAK]